MLEGRKQGLISTKSGGGDVPAPAKPVCASQRDGRHQDNDPQLSRPYWHIHVVYLETDASLAKPVDSQWEGNLFTNNPMM
jgi:hypothetical protein